MYGLVYPFRHTRSGTHSPRRTLLWAIVVTLGMLTLGPPNTGSSFVLGHREAASSFTSCILVTAILARSQQATRSKGKRGMAGATNPLDTPIAG